MSSLQIKLIIAAFLLAVSAFGGYTYYIYHKGETAQSNKQATEQLKTEVKIRKTYEKIDKQTPYGADKSVAIDWLYQHAVK